MWISNIYNNNLHQTYIKHTHYLPGGGKGGGGGLLTFFTFMVTYIYQKLFQFEAVWGRYIRELIYFKTT